MVWLGGFVTIAQELSEAGASKYLGSKISTAIDDLGLPPVPSLAVAYFLTTFMFSSLSAHTVAFVGTFLDAGSALGANPMILTALLSYFGALGGCMVINILLLFFVHWNKREGKTKLIITQYYLLSRPTFQLVWQQCITHQVMFLEQNGLSLDFSLHYFISSFTLLLA